jgi:hypothetical protein
MSISCGVADYTPTPPPRSTAYNGYPQETPARRPQDSYVNTPPQPSTERAKSRRKSSASDESEIGPARPQLTLQTTIEIMRSTLLQADTLGMQILLDTKDSLQSVVQLACRHLGLNLVPIPEIEDLTMPLTTKPN